MVSSLNLQEINTENALSLARFFIRSRQNIAFFGRWGIGKSFISFEAIRETQFKVNYLNASLLDKGDFGLPNMFDPSDVLTFKSPHYLPKLRDGETPNRIL